MTDEPWAHTSLRVSGDGISVGKVAEILGAATVQSRRDNWIVEFGESSDEPIETQLAKVESFIRMRYQAFGELPQNAEVILLVSWTPRLGQDGLALPSSLIETLGQVKAMVLIDAYGDE